MTPHTTANIICDALHIAPTTEELDAVGSIATGGKSDMYCKALDICGYLDIDAPTNKDTIIDILQRISELYNQ